MFFQITSGTFDIPNATPIYHEHGIVEAVIDTVLYDACPKCCKSVRENFCTKCSSNVSPSKMPRCEVLVNQDEEYNSIVLFQSQLTQMLPGPLPTSQDELTAQIVSHLPKQISFTRSPRKKNQPSSTTSSVSKCIFQPLK